LNFISQCGGSALGTQGTKGIAVGLGGHNGDAEKNSFVPQEWGCFLGN
jgi:hypothetical protein